MSWRLGAGDEVALYPLWPLTIWHLAMLARGIKDGIVKNCAGGDLAGDKAAHDIADLFGRAQMGGPVLAQGHPERPFLAGDDRIERSGLPPGASRLHPSLTTPPAPHTGKH